MRFYVRTSRSTNVSVGTVGALVLGLLVVVGSFYLALIVVAVLVLAGIAYGLRAVARRRR
jgi:hypothetical protein